MGVFECGCHVISKTPGIQSTKVRDLLDSCGFKYTRQNRLFEEHSEFVYEDELHILEALTDLTRNHGELPCLSISLRFAICNPESAVSLLVDKAITLAHLLNGYVLLDYSDHDEAQSTVDRDRFIKSLASDYSNRSQFTKEELRVQHLIAKRTVPDFMRDVLAIKKRRSMPADGEKAFHE